MTDVLPATTRPPDETERLSQRNRLTAWWLLGWIALLMAFSIAVIWLRNG